MFFGVDLKCGANQRKQLYFFGNGQSLLLCWYFLMSSPEPLLIENIKFNLRTKVESCLYKGCSRLFYCSFNHRSL
jgi:hypothetical protein